VAQAGIQAAQSWYISNASVNGNYQYSNYYSISYVGFGGAKKESNVAGSSTYFQPGNTSTRYDGNGAIYDVSDQFATSSYRSFVTDQSGRILQKIQGNWDGELSE
jgi:hypothetical protein